MDIDDRCTRSNWNGKARFLQGHIRTLEKGPKVKKSNNFQIQTRSSELLEEPDFHVVNCTGHMSPIPGSSAAENTPTTQDFSPQDENKLSLED